MRFLGIALAALLLTGTAGARIIDGTPRPDRLTGTPRADTIFGRGGADRAARDRRQRLPPRGPRPGCRRRRSGQRPDRCPVRRRHGSGHVRSRARRRQRRSRGRRLRGLRARRSEALARSVHRLGGPARDPGRAGQLHGGSNDGGHVPGRPPVQRRGGQHRLRGLGRRRRDLAKRSAAGTNRRQPAGRDARACKRSGRRL